MTENSFNLVDEPFIPIANKGRVSLKQIFTQPDYRALGGNPVQKIAITKFLLAIAQAACTPEDDDEWTESGAEGLAQKCLAYLTEHHDDFWLYGEKPFLQMPQIAQATTQNLGAVLPEIATGNTTVLNSIQIESELSDADKAMLIVQLMGFGLGGKKTDNSIVLTAGYSGKSNEKGKASTGKAGTSLGFMGFLHSFLMGETLLQTLWLNLLTHEQINGLGYKNGLGVAPWEKMPNGEECETAKQLQNSLMGRLIPLSRFCLLNDVGLHYSEGISHLDYKSGMVDPSVALSIKDKKVLWVDPERRPWRSLTALLSFMEKNGGGSDCIYIRGGLGRVLDSKILPIIGVWSGGLRVSSNAGEQYVSGQDDFVESITFLNTADANGSDWFVTLKNEMDALEHLSKIVYSSTFNYFKDQKSEGKNEAAQATHLFWQLCERKSQDLVFASEKEGEEQRKKLRQTFARFAYSAYETYCSNETARQHETFAKYKPYFGKYLKDTKSQETQV
ncbi:MAG: type I-E CRISPR-associated protein Cse1/CasA [Methylococcales bacterium]|nr:type I-E CRISPR-associated protein Cse1/CasA [Methylococcales bacterium]